MITEYIGEYTVTSYGGNAQDGGTYTAAAMTGCFFMILAQPVGGATGQSLARYEIAASATSSPDAFGDGEPNEPGTENEVFLDGGSLTSFTLNGLTASSGTGALSFTNTAGSTATGTITITGSETFVDTVDAVRRRLSTLGHVRGMFIEAR
jgi:hypothetical protein